MAEREDEPHIIYCITNKTNGKKYRSISQLCKSTGMDKDVVKRLLKDGEVHKLDEKFHRPTANATQITFEGVVYPSKNFFMREFSISGKEFSRLLDLGYVTKHV